MKKLLAIAAMATTLVSSATMVDWKYSGVAADNNASIYLFVGDTAPTSIESLEALQGNGSVVNTGKTVAESSNPRTGAKSYLATGSAEHDWSAGDKEYYVLVSSDKSTFYVDPTATTIAAGNIYEKGSAPGDTVNTSTTASTHSYGAWGGGGTDPLPEPTSGLLLLVGGAVLALRRKQK